MKKNILVPVTYTETETIHHDAVYEIDETTGEETLISEAYDETVEVEKVRYEPRNVEMTAEEIAEMQTKSIDVPPTAEERIEALENLMLEQMGVM